MLIGKLFDQKDLKLETEMVPELEQDSGEGAFSLPVLKRRSNTATIDLFKQPLKANGAFEARLRMLGTGAKTDPFGTGEECELRAGFNVALLDVDTSFGINGEGSGSAGGLTVSGKAAATGELRYRHWLPVPTDKSRLNALSLAVSRSRLPPLVGLAQGAAGYPDIGEVHRLDGKLSLELGLEVGAGRSLQEELTVDLFGGLSTGLTVAGEATVKAALGFSWMDRMAVTVGRACQLHDGWVRLRLQRARERRMSFSAGVTLEFHYDLGSGLESILEEALDQEAMPALVEDLRKIAAPLADGDWDAVRGKLTGAATERVAELMDDTGWREWVADSPEVARLTEISRRIVEAYDGIDPLIESWINRLVGRVDLKAGSEQLRAVLEQVAALDPQRPVEALVDDLVDGDARELLDLVETFTGKSLEDLLLDSDQTVRRTLGRAIDLAQQGLSLLGRLQRLPDEVDDFLESTGIARTVGFLSDSTVTKKAIEAQVSGRIRRVVEKLVGKAWSKVTKADLDRVRSWAERVQALLDAPEQVEAKIKAHLEKLKLDYGLSMSLEIERVSRSTALLDLELDIAQAQATLQNKLAMALVRGDIQRLLQVLAEEAGGRKEDDDSPLPFQLRECVFTSERLRTTSFSAALSILGFGHEFIASLSGVTRRIEQSSLRVHQEGASFVRSADYAAGFERIDGQNKATSAASVWVECRDQGLGLDLRAPYNLESAQRTMCLTFQREDDLTTEEELTSLDHLLRDLGFADDPAAGVMPPPAPDQAAGGLTRRAATRLLPPGCRTRFTLEIRLPGDAVAAISDDLESSGGEQAWDMAFLNATHRWLTDPAVQRLPIKPFKASVGPVLVAFLKRPVFLSNWRSGNRVLLMAVRDASSNQLEVEVGNVRHPIQAIRQTGGSAVWEPPYGLLTAIVRKRKSGLLKMRDVGRKWQDVAARTPKDYDALLPAFAADWRRAWVYAVNWPNPLFGVWLAVARVTAQHPDLLPQARGLAVLQFKAEGQEDWSPRPWIWRLDKGIPNNLARGTFPFG